MTLLVVVTSSEATLEYQVAVGKVYRRCQASNVLADDIGSAILKGMRLESIVSRNIQSWSSAS